MQPAFMAANMSLAMDDTDKIKVLVEDAVVSVDWKFCLRISIIPTIISNRLASRPASARNRVTQIR